MMPLCDSHGIDPTWQEPAEDAVQEFFDNLEEVLIRSDEKKGLTQDTTDKEMAYIATRLEEAAAAAAAKPAPQAADALRQEFIVSRYVRRLYGPLPHMLPGGSPQSALWDAAENGDVRCAQFHMQ